MILSRFNKIKSILFILIILCHTQVISQELQEEDALETHEELSEQSDLIELLEQLRANPIDLNRTNLQQLQQIPWLTPVEAKAILDYRNEIGSFSSLYELKRVHGFSDQTLQSIKNYVKIVPAESSTRPFQARFRSRFKRRIEKSSEYQTGRYPDSPAKLYNRLDLQALGKFDGTILIEKDSGEKQWNDLSLFYIRLRELPLNTQVIIGNYYIKVGQGLVLWGTSGYSKGLDPITPVKKRAKGLRPYTSVDENGAFYGLAIQSQTKWLKWLAFASQNKLDATLTDDNKISSLHKSGFHRTTNESAKKDLLEEKVMGIRCQFNWKNHLNLGTTVYNSRYSIPICNTNPSRTHFAFQGKKNRVAGFDFDLYFKHLNIFMEIAQSENKKNGFISGAIFNFDKLKYSVLYRNYDKNFQSLHAHGFGGISGLPQNERGIYTGFKYQLFPNTRIAFYYDFYKFPWRRYFEEMPSQGEDFSLCLTHKLVSNYTIRLRWRQKIVDETTTIQTQYHLQNKPLIACRRRFFRLQMDYRASARLLFRNRIEQCWIDYPLSAKGIPAEVTNESGIILYHDVKYKPIKSLSIQGRLCFFDTKSFVSRIYVFENDLPGMLTNRMFVGKGTLWYVLLSYNLFNKIKFNLKYSSLYEDDRYKSGNGDDSVIPDTIHDLAIQIETNL